MTVQIGAGRSLAILAGALLFSMATWFSGSVVLSEVQDDWHLSSGANSWITIAVQIGFVVGALLSAGFSLADVVSPRRLMAVGAVGAACANLGLLLVDSAAEAIVLRFLTGLFLAGVYPPAIKAMAAWYQRGRAVALGVMVGALTLGSALPHLVRASGGADWRVVVIVTSLSTVVGGSLALVVADGPYAFPSAPFDPRQWRAVLRDRGVRLTTFGYFGHMWELYAMWTWVGVFLFASFQQAGVAGAATLSAAAAFGSVAIGGLGCVIGGLLADRFGREWLTSLAMVLSGTSCIVVGFVYGASPWLVLLVVGFWGFWVIADSAQFSTLVTEVADQRYVGTAVTLQLALGFVLTVATIWLVPILVEIVGWRWAFAVLAVGPFLGTWAMRLLARERGAATTQWVVEGGAG